MVARRKKPAVLREATPTHSDSAQQQLSLPQAENRPQAVPAIPARRLWLCVHLQALPLEALDDDELPAARAVFADERGVRQVLLANKAARATGIVPGLSVNAALALQPGLCLLERNPDKEQQLIRRLAAWAEQFTSFACIEPPSVLLLEIAGSLRLFGGLLELRQKITADLRQQGLTSSLAIAPTPLAATWLAKAGRRVCIQAMQNLTGAISPLPLHCLDWPKRQYETLQGMGITCIGDCLRLPRQGFAKRFGAARLLELDRATGRLPDPRVSYRTPEQFCVEYELSAEQSDSALILNACEQLLQELGHFLLTRQLVVQRVQFSFFYLRAPATHLTLGSAEAGRNVSRWLELLAIRFERISLTAPVISIRLRGGRSQALAARNEALPFSKADKNKQSGSLTHLVERLSARIGDEAVHGVSIVAEHRPQYAWRSEPLLNQSPQCPAPPAFWHEQYSPRLLSGLQKTNSLLLRRPLWMLPEPQVLTASGGQPVYQGRLELVDGPERIETGWWDDQGIARDYFVAVNPRGIHLWVYRNRAEQGGWYLHGVFG
ncbi:MAG: Y-family DNA polymerase [Gammaproteobacteria bacterium]